MNAKALSPYKQKLAIRRANLRMLAAQRAENKELATELGWSESQLSQLIGPKPARNVTEAVATHVEHRLGLAAGWMSEDHGATQE